MGQRRTPEDAEVEKSGDVWILASSGSLQHLSARCMDEQAASRMEVWSSAEEMVNPKQSHLEAHSGLKC